MSKTCAAVYWRLTVVSTIYSRTDGATPSLRIRKLIGPPMRRAVFSVSLIDMANAARTILYKLRTPASPPNIINKEMPLASINATNRVLLTSLVSAGAQTSKRCRDAAFSRSNSGGHGSRTNIFRAYRKPSAEPHRPPTSPSVGEIPLFTDAIRGPTPMEKPYVFMALYTGNLHASKKTTPPTLPTHAEDFHTGQPPRWVRILLFRRRSSLFTAIANARAGPEDAKRISRRAPQVQCAPGDAIKKICKFACAYRQFCT